VKNRILLDSFAVLAWMQDEPGAAKVEVCACNETLSLTAARIKADFPLAFADAIAAAAAQREGASVVTGDPEFKKIEHLVPIEWL